MSTSNFEDRESRKRHSFEEMENMKGHGKKLLKRIMDCGQRPGHVRSKCLISIVFSRESQPIGMVESSMGERSE